MTTFDLRAFDPPLTLPRRDCGPVVLRPFCPDDLAMVREASRDPYIPLITSLPAQASDADALSFIERQQARADDGHGYSLVIAAAEGEQRGWGSIGLWLRDIENGRATVGYWLVPEARGSRAAGWALRGLAAFAFEDLAIPRLQLYIEPWNVASVHTAEFAGFAFEARLRGWERIDGAQHDADCFSLLRDDWRAP
jgi:RimJ/RimL family protein N-acetyltransferase